jgi:adenosylcobinamide-GDP ribazoletransferase
MALAALIRLPTVQARAAGATDPGRAAPWYPAAGLVLGLLLGLWAALLQGLPPFLAATLVVALWMGLTGLQPLQALAATVEGYVTGDGNHRRIAAAMHGSKRGRAALAAVVVAVLAKTVGLGCLLGQEAWGAVVAVPLAGGLLLAAVLASTPPSPEEPSASALLPSLDRAAVLLGVVAGLAVLVGVLGLLGLGVGAALLGLTALLRWLYKRTLGGFSRDLLGAARELGELAALGINVWGLGAC